MAVLSARWNRLNCAPAPADLRQDWTLIVERLIVPEFDRFVSEFRERFASVVASVSLSSSVVAPAWRMICPRHCPAARGYVALTQSNLRLASFQALDESAVSLRIVIWSHLVHCMTHIFPAGLR